MSETKDFRIGTYNIGNSERTSNSPFDLREPDVLDAIHAIDCDILVLNELQEYRDSVNRKNVSVSYFLGRMSNYDHIYQYTTPSTNSFAIGILYKKRKFFHVKTVCIPLPGNRILLGAQFLFKLNNNQPFWIWATYLTTCIEEIKLSCELIAKYILKEVDESTDYFLLGDFQLFNFQPEHEKILKKFIDISGLYDVGQKTIFSFDNSMDCYGTYLGFHDSPYRVSTNEFFEEQTSSRVDFIFATKDAKTSLCQAHATTLSEINNQFAPSDHLPIFCSVQLSS